MNDAHLPRDFKTTRWSLVLTAGGADSPEARRALADLCETYWYPLYSFLRRRGVDADDARDLTQAFFLHLLEKRMLQRANPARGRFRSFLLVSVKNFAENERGRRQALKRGGGASQLSLDMADAEGRFQLEPRTGETPETLYDRAWAVTLLQRAIARLRSRLESSGKGQHFDGLRIYLTGEEPHASYAETAAAVGMTEGALKVAVHRLRRQFRDLVRDEIAQTVGSQSEVDDELRYLRSVVSR